MDGSRKASNAQVGHPNGPPRRSFNRSTASKGLFRNPTPRPGTEVKCATCVLLALILFSGAAALAADMPPKLSAQTDEVIFLISGNVVDREPNAILVWGLAVPVNTQGEIPFGTLARDSNIVVLNPGAEGLSGSYYVGYHCFRRKKSGTNAFGAPVPLWEYADCRLVNSSGRPRR